MKIKTFVVAGIPVVLALSGGGKGQEFKDILWACMSLFPSFLTQLPEAFLAYTERREPGDRGRSVSWVMQTSEEEEGGHRVTGKLG